MISVLCYGNSNTFGRKSVSFDPKEASIVFSQDRLQPDERWTGVMLDELGKDYHVIEEGLCGRTTVLDDPVGGEHRNGKKYLLPCLESNAPLDLVILILGTNDLKMKFSMSAYDISMGIAVLIKIIRNSNTGREGNPPKILVISPPPLGKLTYYAKMFKGGNAKSKKLSLYYHIVSKQFGCYFLNASTVIKSSPIDGLHFEKDDHKTLGKTVANKVREIFSS